MICSNCDTKITFLTSLKQPTPYRYKCGNCKTRFKVRTPGMNMFMALVVFLFVLLTVGMMNVYFSFGMLLAVPMIVFMIALWMIIEVLTHSFIMEKGVFSPIEERRTEMNV